MNAAVKLQAEREAADLVNHRERVVWLEQAAPLWACGEPVDIHTKNVMLRQSRDAITKDAP